MLELVVVICIIGLLIALALERLLVLRVEAERAAMEEVLGALRAGVAMEMVSSLVHDESQALAELHRGNPMATLMQVPSTYLGEFEAPDPQQIPGSRWYFDRRERLLVYRVRYGDYFETELEGPPRARFRLEVAFADRDGNERFDVGVDTVRGVAVEPAESYRWRDP